MAIADLSVAVERVGAAGDAADDVVRPVVQPGLHGGERGRREVRLRHGAVGGMLRLVHLQQAADDIRLAEHPLQALLGHSAGEKGARSRREGGASALYLRDITVAAEQPERAHARGVDPKHRGLGAQQFERGLKSCIIGVAVGRDDEAGGLVNLVAGSGGWRRPSVTHAKRGCGSGVRDRRGTRNHSLPPFFSNYKVN
jgi:hypothetical protein